MKTVSVTVALQMQEVKKRQHGGQQAAHKLHQAGAHQVAHALHIGHDARHQRAGAVLIVVGDREQAHVPLHLAAHLGNQPLAGFREQLRERERSDGLHHHGRENQRNDAEQAARDAGAAAKAPCPAAAWRCRASTSPATRLMAINTSPEAINHFRGATSAQICGHSFFRSGLRLGNSAGPARAPRVCGVPSPRLPIPTPRITPIRYTFPESRNASAT